MIDLLLRYVLPALPGLLPRSMDTPPARAMLLAIALQESKALARRQASFGPARGFWQFELGGVRGVMRHPASRGHAREVLRALRYEKLIGSAAETSDIHKALEHNDLLAAAFARLLLWTLPGPLATHRQVDSAWSQYLLAWRPGKPHPETWSAHFDEAWHRLEVAGPVPLPFTKEKS